MILPPDLGEKVCSYLEQQRCWRALYELKHTSPRWHACVQAVAWRTCVLGPNKERYAENLPIYDTLLGRPLLSTDEPPDMVKLLIEGTGGTYIQRLVMPRYSNIDSKLFKVEFCRLRHLVLFPDDRIFIMAAKLFKTSARINKLTVLSEDGTNVGASGYYDFQEDDDFGDWMVDICDAYVPICKLLDGISQTLTHLAFKTTVRIPSLEFLLGRLPCLQYLEFDHLIVDDIASAQDRPTCPLLTLCLNCLVISEPNIPIPVGTQFQFAKVVELIHCPSLEASTYADEDWCTVVPLIPFLFTRDWPMLTTLSRVQLDCQTVLLVSKHCPNLVSLQVELRAASHSDFERCVLAFRSLAKCLPKLETLNVCRAPSDVVDAAALPMDYLFFEPAEERPTLDEASDSDNREGTSGHIPSSEVTLVLSWTHLKHLRLSLGQGLTPRVLGPLCQLEQLEVLHISLTRLGYLSRGLEMPRERRFSRLKKLRLEMDPVVEDSWDVRDLKCLIELFPVLAVLEVSSTTPLFHSELEAEFPSIAFIWL